MHFSLVRVIRATLLRWVGSTLLISLGCIAATAAQAPCHGPVGLERAIRAKPSAATYDALGAWFAGHNQISCAVAAFESAVQIDSKFWEAHHNLALAHIAQRAYPAAIQHLSLALREKPDLLPARNALGTVLLETEKLGPAETEFREVIKLDPNNVYALDRLAHILSAQGRYVAAITFWNKAVAVEPADADMQIAVAVAHSQNGDEKRAIEILKALTKAQPNVALAHFNLATIYAHQDGFSAAADEYKESLRLNPKDDVSRLSLIKALTTLSRNSEALSFALEYAHDHPADYEAHYLLGVVYRGLGDLDKATLELERAASLKSDDSEVQYNLGFALVKTGKPQEALPHLEKALQLNPDSSAALFQLMNVFRSLGLDERARAMQEKFQNQKQKSLSKNVIQVKGIQANDLLKSGDARGAKEVYREMLQLDPNNARTWYNLALTLGKLNDLKGERAALEKALALEPKMARAHSQLGLIDLSEGRTIEAKQHFQAALAIDPQMAENQGNLGVIFSRQGKISEAESLFRQAVENDPRYREGHLNLGLTLAQQDRFAEAREHIERAVAIAPQDAQALSALGKVQVRMGNGLEAIATFQKVVSLQPASAEAHLNLGIALADNYDLDGAFKEFTEAGRLAPDSAAVRFNKGRVLLDQRRYEESRIELDAAYHMAPDFGQARYMLALVEKNLGHPKQAVMLLESVVKLEPRNADAWYLLGRNLQDMGNSKQAVEAWKKALTIHPDQPQALFNLSRSLRREDPEQASRYESRFVALKKEQQLLDEAETLGNFALASAKAHDWPQAINHLQEAIRICGDCRAKADLYKNLGLINCQSGALETGEKELRTAQSLKPGDVDIQKAIAIVQRALTSKSQRKTKEH